MKVITGVKIFLLTGLFLTWMCHIYAGSPVGRLSEKEWSDLKVKGERILDLTFEALNKGEYRQFRENFSSKRVLSETGFKAVWVDDYKERYGEFVSKEFLEEISNPVKNYPLITYKAVFTKNKEVGIRCVLTRDDDGKYRIFYLRLDPYPDLFR